METLTIVVLVVVGLIIVVPTLFFLWLWNKSFIHTAFIAKQSGKDISDVIWVQDKFKVIEKDGHHVIVFKWHKGRSQSFPGDFWTKFFNNRSVKFTDDMWTRLNLKKLIGRGLFLYQNTEGEFHPIALQDGEHGPHFKVLSQDNRAYLVQGLRQTQALTLTAKKQIIAIVAVVIAIIILAVLFFLFLMYLTEAATDICGVAGPNMMATAQGVVGG